MDNKTLIVIVGPTAIGKTKVAVELAKILDSEIVCADSMQIYKSMDIGSAKPTTFEMGGITHHMLDFLDPREEFSVVQYQELANKCIKNIHKEGKLPILTGGTGLYINSVIYPMNFSDVGIDREFRQKLIDESKTSEEGSLHTILEALDPIRSSKINPNDTKRIVRALEIHHISGRKASELEQSRQELAPIKNALIFGLNVKREALYNAINKRVDEMFALGLIEEVQNLKEMGCNIQMQSMQGLGYKQVLEFLDEKIGLPDTIELVKRNTRRYAKRQLTWFKKNKDTIWLDIEDFTSHRDLAMALAVFIKENDVSQKH